MRDTLEVYAYLHEQRHGVTVVTRTDTIVGKVSLPTNLIEFSTAKEKGPGWVLLRLPRFLANEYGLVRSSPDVPMVNESAIAEALTRSISEDSPTPTSSGIIGNSPVIPRPKSLLSPKRQANESHLLTDARAKTISQQLADSNMDIA